MIPTFAGIVTLQTCEIVFRYCKEHIARVNKTFRPRSRVDRVHAIENERAIQSIPKSVIKWCLRSVEHFIHAWLARSQVS